MKVYLKMLGDCRLFEGGPHGEVVIQESKPVLMLAVLSTLPEYTARRPYLASMLWPAPGEGRALASLRQALYYLTQKWETPLLVADEESVALIPEAIDSDLWAFEEHLREGRDREAVAVYRGKFLQDHPYVNGDEFEEWRDIQRQRVDDALEAAYHRIVERAIERDLKPDAVNYATRLRHRFPEAIDSYEALIEAHLMAGNPLAAMDTYFRYRDRWRSVVEKKEGRTITERDVDHHVQRLRAILETKAPFYVAEAVREGKPIPEEERGWRPERGHPMLEALGIDDFSQIGTLPWKEMMKRRGGLHWLKEEGWIEPLEDEEDGEAADVESDEEGAADEVAAGEGAEVGREGAGAGAAAPGAGAAPSANGARLAAPGTPLWRRPWLWLAAGVLLGGLLGTCLGAEAMTPSAEGGRATP